MKDMLRWVDDDPYDDKPGRWYDAVLGFVAAIAAIFIGIFAYVFLYRRYETSKVKKR